MSSFTYSMPLGVFFLDAIGKETFIAFPRREISNSLFRALLTLYLGSQPLTAKEVETLLSNVSRYMLFDDVRSCLSPITY